MSFRRESRDRSFKNDSDVDDQVPEKGRKMSFELHRKHFHKKFDEQNKKDGMKRMKT